MTQDERRAAYESLTNEEWERYIAEFDARCRVIEARHCALKITPGHDVFEKWDAAESILTRIIAERPTPEPEKRATAPQYEYIARLKATPEELRQVIEGLSRAVTMQPREEPTPEQEPTDPFADLRRWVPEDGDEYPYVDDEGDLRCDQWNDGRADIYRLRIGNVHRTEADARAYRDDKGRAIWTRMRELADIVNEEPGWEPGNGEAYFIGNSTTAGHSCESWKAYGPWSVVMLRPYDIPIKTREGAQRVLACLIDEGYLTQPNEVE